MHDQTTTVEIQGDRDRIYALAAAVPRWAEFLPHYRWVRVVDEDAATGQQIVEMACWRGWVPLTWRSILEPVPGERRVRFHHIGGGARGMGVEWRLPQRDGVTTATIAHDLRGLTHPIVATPLGRYILARHMIDPVAGRTLATMKALIEAGATGSEDAARLAAQPGGPIQRREDPRAGLFSWLPWAAWLGTSFVWGRWSRRTLAAAGEARRREEPPGAWQRHLAAFAATFALLAPVVPAGPLDRPFPLGRRAMHVPMIGLAIELAGFGLAFWSRLTLGRYCTARVAVADAQRLVRRGPYGAVRHPIYAGLLLGVLGQALVLGRWRGLAALTILGAAYRRKVRYEETALRQHFGVDYDAYAAQVPAFLPRFRRG